MRYSKNLNFILEKLEGFVKLLTETEIYELTKNHFRILNLIDENDNWVLDELKELDQELLPSNFSSIDCISFIDEIAQVNSENNYLMNFIDKSCSMNYERLSLKLELEGADVIPDVLTYALMLQRLSKICAENYKVFTAIFYHLRECRKKSGSFKQLPLFHKIKLTSIDKPTEKNFLKTHITRKIKPTSGKVTIAINILEATLADFNKKNYGNSFAGKILYKHRCGAKQYDARTGRGPSKWSDDGKCIQRVYPLPRKWAELYQTWNMDFVTRFSDFPYLLPKLLIPQVASVKDCPENYIYNRAIALTLYLNYASFDYVDKLHRNIPNIDWYDDTLNKFWGKCNKECALDYMESVKSAKVIESKEALSR